MCVQGEGVSGDVRYGMEYCVPDSMFTLVNRTVPTITEVFRAVVRVLTNLFHSEGNSKCCCSRTERLGHACVFLLPAMIC